MDSNLISICIPAYSMNGAGSSCLKQLLQSILAQNYSDYEVIISDHSQDDSLLNVCKYFKNNKIKHFYNPDGKGSSSQNINNAIYKSNGNMIKVMFQDDFFVSKDALTIISNTLKKHHWGATGCIHYNSKEKNFYRPHYPRWQDDIKKGTNTIGAPSVLFFNRSNVIFDRRLLWFMDVDFYYCMYKIYGEPYLEEKILVGIREDSTRVTNTLITQELVDRETKIISTKFKW